MKQGLRYAFFSVFTSMMIPSPYRRLLQLAGVDRAVGYTVLGRAWLSIAGLISLAVVGRCLTPDEQGYYYTFGSLLALQVFAELGLGNVILQFASHEAAHLTVTCRGLAGGTPAARSRLASILRLSLRWYGAAAAVFATVLLVAGHHFFANFSAKQVAVSWQLPWTCTVLASAGILLVTPLPALVEGCGMVAEVARCRLFQAVVAHAALWITMLAGAGLSAAAVFAAANLFVMVGWLAIQCRHLLAELWAVKGGEAIDWRGEIWPYQWRIAISWLCGYFTFQIFTPLVFAFQGPVEAGRMGMSLTLAAAVSATGLSWLTTKGPRFGALVSLRRFQELDAMFFRSLRQAIGVSVLCAAAIFALGVVISALDHPLAGRVLAPWPLACLLIASTVGLIVAAQATYLRAYKQEPFFVLSIVNATLTVSSASLFAWLGSTTEMALGYLVINAVVGFGAGTWIFRAKRRLWQQEPRHGDQPLQTCEPSQAGVAA